MTPKQTLYRSLCEQLAPLWEQDEQMLETDPETWQLIRTVDDWLFAHRDNPKVGEEQYARNSDRLQALYVEPVAMAGGER